MPVDFSFFFFFLCSNDNLFGFIHEISFYAASLGNCHPYLTFYSTKSWEFFSSFSGISIPRTNKWLLQSQGKKNFNRSYTTFNGMVKYTLRMQKDSTSHLIVFVFMLIHSLLIRCVFNSNTALAVDLIPFMGHRFKSMDFNWYSCPMQAHTPNTLKMCTCIELYTCIATMMNVYHNASRL